MLTKMKYFRYRILSFSLIEENTGSMLSCRFFLYFPKQSCISGCCPVANIRASYESAVISPQMYCIFRLSFCGWQRCGLVTLPFHRPPYRPRLKLTGTICGHHVSMFSLLKRFYTACEKSTMTEYIRGCLAPSGINSVTPMLYHVTSFLTRGN